MPGDGQPHCRSTLYTVGLESPMILAICVTFLPAVFISIIAVTCSSETFHLHPGFDPPHFFPFLRAASWPALARLAIRTMFLP
jgi:hypothetical protein